MTDIDSTLTDIDRVLSQRMAEAVAAEVPNLDGHRFNMIPGEIDRGFYTGVGVDKDGDVFIHRVGSEDTIYLSADAAAVLAVYLSNYAHVAKAWEGGAMPRLT